MTFVMSSAAVLLPLTYHANYKLVTFWVCNRPVANEDVKMNKLHFIIYHFLFIISVLNLFPTVLMYEISYVHFRVNGFVQMVQLLLSSWY